MTSPHRPREGLASRVNAHLAMIAVVVGLLMQIGTGVWFAASANARISHNSDAIAQIEGRNLPDRLHSVEDGQASMQRDIAALQSEMHEISTGMADQNQRLATIQAKLDFVVSQLFPQSKRSP